jgi:hypothetical protein
MSILFYDHLIDKNEVFMLIEKTQAPDDQKNRLKRMADDIIHHGILEMVLQKLHPHEHDHFLRLVTNAPYDPLVLEFLRKHAGEDIEVEIEKRGRNIVGEILEDLRKEVI